MSISMCYISLVMQSNESVLYVVMFVHAVKKIYLKMKNVPMTSSKKKLAHKSLSKNLIKNHYLSFWSCLSPIYFLIVCQKKIPCNKMKVSDNTRTPDGEIEQEISLSSVLVTQLNKKHQNIELLFINKN